ncbi:MAG TPA: type II secretion system major pseudopilin GspG [Phycisphaerae bacterium]|nr:type II secretion system major pseudopilin GspG [Phycisphaerae bacterium]
MKNKTRHANANWRRSGFTLVELMVVLVILGLLASLVTVSVNDYLLTGRQTTVKAEISQICNALELFYTEFGHYPSNDQGLAVLTEKTRKHPNGILQGKLTDVWGHPYSYVFPGLNETFDVVSYGRDGQEGGEGADADIVSWDLDEADHDD